MSEPQPLLARNVTTLLARAQSGDRRATDELFPLVYQELRELAARYMSQESAAQTLQATALVHDAYIRLVGPGETTWENRRHFFGAAARAMRRILIDHSRAKRRMKRGEGARPSSLDGMDLGVEAIGPDLLALDEALERLMQSQPAIGQLVELRFFGGLSMEEIGLITGSSASTLARQWRFARAWLHRELSSAQSS